MSGGWVRGGCVLLFGQVREARVAGPGVARVDGGVWASRWVAGGESRTRGCAGGLLCRCICPLAAARLCGQL